MGDRIGCLGSWLDQLGDADLPIRRATCLRNASAIFTDLVPPVPPAPGRRYVNADADQFASAAARLRELQSTIPAVADDLMRAELQHTLAVAILAADHAVAARGTPPFPTAARARLRDGFTAALAEHRRLWLLRNRPGGLDHSCSYFQKIIDDLSS